MPKFKTTAKPTSTKQAGGAEVEGNCVGSSVVATRSNGTSSKSHNGSSDDATRVGRTDQQNRVSAQSYAGHPIPQPQQQQAKESALHAHSNPTASRAAAFNHPTYAASEDCLVRHFRRQAGSDGTSSEKWNVSKLELFYGIKAKPRRRIARAANYQRTWM